MSTATGVNRSLDVRASEDGAQAAALDLLTGAGAVVLRGAVNFARLATFLAKVEAEYAAFEALVAKHGTFGAAVQMRPGVRVQPSAAALGLDSIAAWNDVLGAVDPVLLDLAESLVGPHAMLDIDICWLRRQYPESLRASGQAPHTFHQDGAYGYDFGGNPRGGGALLPIVTAWIPLVAAGGDAPGLELVPASLSHVQGLTELADASVEANWPSAERVRPTTEPGDLVLMSGHHLHRTCVSPEMSRARTCIELRFVTHHVPSQLAGHHLLAPRAP